MKNLGLSDSQKAKVNTAVKYLNQVITELGGTKFTGPAAHQHDALLQGATLVEMVQLGNCITRTTKKGA